jgi:MFS family permease
VAAAVLLAAATVRSARHPVPALELSMLRVPAFALAVASALAFFAAFAAMLLSSVLFLTQVWGESIILAGFQLAPGPLMAMVAAVVASRIGPRFGMATIGACGGLLVAVGIASYATRVGLTPDYAGALLPGQLITGAGVGLAMPAFTAVAVGAVDQTRFSTAIGISSMFRQVGGVLGVAALVAILGTPARTEALHAFRHGWVLTIAAAAVGALLMLAARFTPAPRQVAGAPTVDTRVGGGTR